MKSHPLEKLQWIRSRAAVGDPLNLHAVMRERPDLLEQAFALPTPRGWRRCLVDAGVDPYKIAHAYKEVASCAICGFTCPVLGTHLKSCHGTTGEEYIQEFGPDCELSSESFRAAKFGARPVAGIDHWEGLWSRYYVTDWIITLHEAGHDVNFQSLVNNGKALAGAGWKLFGSWDAALQAAGLDPSAERAIPPFLHWTRDMVFEGLRQFAMVKKDNWRLRMPTDLRMAVVRMFGTPEAAGKAAGLKFKEINQRAIFSGRAVTNLVAAVRKLEHLKGVERRRKLDEIYHKNETATRIVKGHFGSLKKLAAQAGIDLRVVSSAAYRDEEDVRHDLDLLENSGARLDLPTLYRDHKRLYNVIKSTGWGADRIKPGLQAPHCSPPGVPR
jgi:hypothetical protein